MFEKRRGEPLNRESKRSHEEFAAGPKTDFFRDPASDNVIASAPFVYNELTGDFTVTARIEPQFQSTYDAGAILVMSNDEEWVKFAYELTDLGYPAIVSVVTRGRSDDCNGEAWPSGSVVYRVSRRGNAIGCYYGPSEDELKMHRLLSVPGTASQPLMVGLSVQSPTGEGSRCRFTDIRVDAAPVADMRKGV